jgi:hypothetical protein
MNMDPRSRRSLRALAAIGLTPLALIGGALSNQPDAAPCPTSGDLTDATIQSTHLNATQLDNAAIITRIGPDMHVPAPGETIAVATALQESDLHNLAHGDRDSLGCSNNAPPKAGEPPPRSSTPPTHHAPSTADSWPHPPGAP